MWVVLFLSVFFPIALKVSCHSALTFSNLIVVALLSKYVFLSAFTRLYVRMLGGSPVGASSHLGNGSLFFLLIHLIQAVHGIYFAKAVIAFIFHLLFFNLMFFFFHLGDTLECHPLTRPARPSSSHALYFFCTFLWCITCFLVLSIHLTLYIHCSISYSLSFYFKIYFFIFCSRTDREAWLDSWWQWIQTESHGFFVKECYAF